MLEKLKQFLKEDLSQYESLAISKFYLLSSPLKTEDAIRLFEVRKLFINDVIKQKISVTLSQLLCFVNINAIELATHYKYKVPQEETDLGEYNPQEILNFGVVDFCYLLKDAKRLDLFDIDSGVYALCYGATELNKVEFDKDILECSTEELADFYKLDEYYFKFAYLLTHKAPNIGLIQINQTQLSILFLADKKKTHFLTILTLVSIVKELSEENKLALRDALLTFDKNFLTKDNLYLTLISVSQTGSNVSDLASLILYRNLSRLMPKDYELLAILGADIDKKVLSSDGRTYTIRHLFKESYLKDFEQVKAALNLNRR